jgi:hypothetical protein
VTDPVAAATLARVRAQLEFEAGRPADAAGIMLDWVAMLGPADLGAAQAVLAEAIHILWLDASPAHPEPPDARNGNWLAASVAVT